MKNQAQRWRIITFILCLLTLPAMAIPGSILWCSYGYNLEIVYTYVTYYTYGIAGYPAILLVIASLYVNFRSIAQHENYTILHWLLSIFLFGFMYLLGVFLFATQHCRNVYFVWQPFLPPALILGSMLTSVFAWRCDILSKK